MTSQKAKYCVLVYGTLRQGGYNHSLMGEAEFLASLKLSGFTMVSLGSYPAVYLDAQAEEAIYAELYTVDAATFARLDRLEGYPEFYNRSQVEVSLVNGQQVNAWIYHMTKEELSGKEKVKGGDWLGAPSLRNTSPL